MSHHRRCIFHPLFGRTPLPQTNRNKKKGTGHSLVVAADRKCTSLRRPGRCPRAPSRPFGRAGGPERGTQRRRMGDAWKSVRDALLFQIIHLEMIQKRRSFAFEWWPNNIQSLDF